MPEPTNRPRKTDIHSHTVKPVVSISSSIFPICTAMRNNIGAMHITKYVIPGALTSWQVENSALVRIAGIKAYTQILSSSVKDVTDVAIHRTSAQIRNTGMNPQNFRFAIIQLLKGDDSIVKIDIVSVDLSYCLI